MLVTLNSMVSLLVTTQLHTRLFISFLSLGPFVVLVFEEELLLPGSSEWVGRVSSWKRTKAPSQHLTDGSKGGLACSQWLAQSVFLSRTRLPRGDTIHNELNPPTNMPKDRSDGGNALIEGHSSQVILACVELTETSLHSYQY